MPTKAPFTDLDAMLTPDECAAWLGVKRREVLENPKIPKVRLGHKTVRFHPRTIIAAGHKKP